MRTNPIPYAAFTGIFTASAVALFAQTASPTPTAAAEAAKRNDSVITLGTFTVSGTRASLAKSREFKQESRIISDTIVAEDVAKFPDLNLAEALQRLPGVAINREAGEGRRVSLRGLGPDFTRVQLNGMEVLGNVDSPQDSRGQGSRDRAFDFNIFASELFSRMDVYKGFDASQNEGGLAGTIGLVTAKPFDKPGFNAALSAQGGSNTQTKDFQPRTAFLISDTWGKKFGALLSVAYSNRDTEEQGTNTYRWRLMGANGTNISALPAADQAAINSGKLRFARGNRLSAWQSHQKRLGITSAFQWKPTDDLDFTLDVLHGEFKGKRDELHLASYGTSSESWLGGSRSANGVAWPAPTIKAIRYNAGNEVVYLDVGGAYVDTETRRQMANNTFNQVGLSGNWRINDRLKASGLVGTERSEFDMPISDKFYLKATGDVISDYTIDRFYLHNTYKFDTANPAIWHAEKINFGASNQQTNFDNAKIDFDLFLQPGSSLKFGASHQLFSNKGYTQANENLLQSAWASGAINTNVVPYARKFSAHKDQSWVIVDFDAALKGFGVTRAAGPRANIYKVEEATDGAYSRYDWDTTIAGMDFNSNAGVRAYKTKVTSSGTANVGPVTVAKNYDDILPALNTTLKLRKNLLLRTSLSRNINRPTLGSLAVNGSVTQSGGDIKVNAGNPSLKPYKSDNIDLSLEWYFGDVGYVAAGYFHKDITGFIGTLTSTNVLYGTTGLPLDLLPGLTASTNVAEYSRPINYEGTTLQGVEFTAQSDLKFLPAAFKGLGFVGNISFIDGKLDYASPAQQAAGVSIVKPIAGLSKVLGNATLYYETRKWGARVSANYRGGYIRYPLPIGTDEDSDGMNSTVYVDCSAFYQLSPKMKLTFDVINLTDQREVQWSDSAHRLYNTTTAGTSFFAGINYKF